VAVDCKADAGVFVPVVDHGKCEGKNDCVRVCPYDVFEVTRIRDADFKNVALLSRFKVAVHGMKTAYTPRSEQCQACGMCVAACPEKAITLSRRGS